MEESLSKKVHSESAEDQRYPLREGNFTGLYKEDHYQRYTENITKISQRTTTGKGISVFTTQVMTDLECIHLMLNERYIFSVPYYSFFMNSYDRNLYICAVCLDILIFYTCRIFNTDFYYV